MLYDILWKDEKGASSLRWTLELFQRQQWENFCEMGWSTCELSEHIEMHHLELNSYWNLQMCASRGIVILGMVIRNITYMHVMYTSVCMMYTCIDVCLHVTVQELCSLLWLTKVTVLCVLCPPCCFCTVLCPPCCFCTVLCHWSFSVVDVLCKVLHVISRMLLYCAVSSVLLLYCAMSSVLLLYCAMSSVLLLNCAVSSVLLLYCAMFSLLLVCYCTMLYLQCCYCTAPCLQCCYCTVCVFSVVTVLRRVFSVVTVLCVSSVLWLYCAVSSVLWLYCSVSSVLLLYCAVSSVLLLYCAVSSVLWLYCAVSSVLLLAVTVCRGGKICLTDHFKPLWARNVPKFGIAHAMALGVRSSCALSVLLSSPVLRKTRWISDRHCAAMCAVAMLSFHVLCYLKKII